MPIASSEGGRKHKPLSRIKPFNPDGQKNKDEYIRDIAGPPRKLPRIKKRR